MIDFGEFLLRQTENNLLKLVTISVSLKYYPIENNPFE